MSETSVPGLGTGAVPVRAVDVQQPRDATTQTTCSPSGWSRQRSSMATPRRAPMTRRHSTHAGNNYKIVGTARPQHLSDYRAHATLNFEVDATYPSPLASDTGNRCHPPIRRAGSRHCATTPTRPVC